MSPFGSVYTTSLGATHLCRVMEQDAMRRGFRAPPEEKEQHFEQASKFRDLGFLGQLIRGIGLG